MEQAGTHSGTRLSFSQRDVVQLGRNFPTRQRIVFGLIKGFDGQTIKAAATNFQDSATQAGFGQFFNAEANGFGGPGKTAILGLLRLCHPAAGKQFGGGIVVERHDGSLMANARERARLGLCSFLRGSG